jgi:hypothetical protein
MSWQNLNLVGEKLFEELPAGVDPATARIIFKLMEAQLLREQIGGDARLADELLKSLRGEFEPGGVAIILRAAERAARRGEKRQRTVGNRQSAGGHGGGKQQSSNPVIHQSV